MQHPEKRGLTRREVMTTTGTAAAVSALAGVAVPLVHAGESATIQAALIGCGGRGTGAAANAMNSRNGPVKLAAMADVFPGRLTGSYNSLQRSHARSMDVPESKRFIGFDAYKQAMDALRPGDIAILATPPAFRWVQFKYAIDKGLNVFMEKPITVDGPSTRKMLELGEQSVRRNLKVGVGLMCRHCQARGELFQRIKDGAIGDLTLLRAYRLAGRTAREAAEPKPDGISELMYQIREFHSFLWASGGSYSDFLIHNIDECCWMKDDWPVSAKGLGGRHFRGTAIDQNFDSYHTEFTFADGSKLLMEGRTIPGCHQEFSSYAHGTKGSAIISQSGHAPSYCRIFRGQNNTTANNQDVTWRPSVYGRNEPDPYQLEWDHLIDSIKNDRRHNEVQRGAMASLVTAMGRFACHTGNAITRDQMLNHDHEFAPEVDKLTLDGPSPLRAGPDGKYPVPMPGTNRNREY